MSKKVDNSIHKNGLIKGEFALLKIFVKEPWKAFTLSDIKKISKNKSHHYVFDAMKKFAKIGILLEEKRGNTNIYSLNYETNEHIGYLAFVEFLLMGERKDIPYKNLKKIAEKIKNPFYSMLICGSYAANTQKPTSDIDLAIIVSGKADKKSAEIALKEGELMIPEVHGFIFTYEEFYAMLINKEYNYGKECAKKHIIAYGAEQYYMILFRAMKHGFKG